MNRKRSLPDTSQNGETWNCLAALISRPNPNSGPHRGCRADRRPLARAQSHSDAGVGSGVMQPLAEPLLGIGEVRHARLRPKGHCFAYPTYFLMLPLRALRVRPSPELARNRFGLLSFRDADHGDGRADCLAWIDELLERQGIADAAGEVWLHCIPRILGFTFKPVSFWYCHRRNATLA